MLIRPLRVGVLVGLGVAICSIAAAQSFELSAPAVAVGFSPADGIAPFSFICTVEELGVPAVAPAQAFSLGLQVDPTLVTIGGAIPSGPIALLHTGGGPDYFGVGIHTDGITIGCVFAFDLTETLVLAGPTDIVEITGQGVSTALLGQANPLATGLNFVDTLGAPPVENAVAVNFAEFAPVLSPGVLTFEPAADLLFIRGDLDGSISINLADVIQLFLYVFDGVGGDCLDSLDVNDDGVIDIADGVFELNYIFEAGVAPAAPFPACASDGTIDLLDCALTTCP